MYHLYFLKNPSYRTLLGITRRGSVSWPFLKFQPGNYWNIHCGKNHVTHSISDRGNDIVHITSHNNRDILFWSLHINLRTTFSRQVVHAYRKNILVSPTNSFAFWVFSLIFPRKSFGVSFNWLQILLNFAAFLQVETSCVFINELVQKSKQFWQQLECETKFHRKLKIIDWCDIKRLVDVESRQSLNVSFGQPSDNFFW